MCMYMYMYRTPTTIETFIDTCFQGVIHCVSFRIFLRCPAFLSILGLQNIGTKMALESSLDSADATISVGLNSQAFPGEFPPFRHINPEFFFLLDPTSRCGGFRFVMTGYPWFSSISNDGTFHYQASSYWGTPMTIETSTLHWWYIFQYGCISHTAILLGHHGHMGVSINAEPQ